MRFMSLNNVDRLGLSRYSFSTPFSHLAKNNFIMYVATTRFQIILGQELLFETTWRERESYLNSMKGYRGLLLLRGAIEVDHSVYFSQFIWNTKEDFENWTNSEAFIKAHLQFGNTAIMFHKKPVFEDFTVVIQETAGKPHK